MIYLFKLVPEAEVVLRVLERRVDLFRGHHFEPQAVGRGKEPAAAARLLRRRLALHGDFVVEDVVVLAQRGLVGARRLDAVLAAQVDREAELLVARNLAGPCVHQRRVDGARSRGRGSCCAGGN